MDALEVKIYVEAPKRIENEVADRVHPLDMIGIRIVAHQEVRIAGPDELPVLRVGPQSIFPAGMVPCPGFGQLLHWPGNRFILPCLMYDRWNRHVFARSVMLRLGAGSRHEAILWQDPVCTIQ